MATVTESGLDRTEFAASSYRAYMHAMGVPNPDWEKASEAHEALFLRLADLAGPFLEEHQDDTVAATADALWERVNGWGVPLEATTPPGKWAWQALLRHMNYLIDAEDTDDRVEREPTWKQWVEEKLKENGK